MADHSQTALNVIQILILVGGVTGIQVLVRYLWNIKKNKSINTKDLYAMFNESTKDYIEQTADLSKLVTEMRQKNNEMQQTLFCMDQKLDAKNKQIQQLSEETKENTKKITELLERSEILENKKCEREECETRIPPPVTHKTIEQQKAS